ncbi:MAG: nucleotidyltransferase domain-containing protein [Clostridiales bacterium]|jgi:predicted nucleotidyltransferase|nr:nucleotidyltransferase domain-containing protein [Clostridiales bacterium]
MISVTPHELEIVKDILRGLASDCEARVFGSRYKGVTKEYSDLDIALIGRGRLGLARIAAIEEAFQESALPYRVDVLDWYSLSDEFRAIISSGYALIDPRL